MIPTDRYHTQAAFDRENAEFWPRQWVCVGTTHQLMRHDDFITHTVGGRGVVIQNIDGHLRAFTNVCSHRFNRLQTDRCGNRSLVCRYHGWGYDCEGVPNRIPSRPRFDQIDPASHSLERWHLQVCGTLVFVSLRPDKPLGLEMGDAVEQSNAYGGLVDTNQMLVACNWKLFVENTLEGYHVPWVHPDSIMRIMGSESQFAFQGPHSSVQTVTKDKRLDDLDRRFADRPYRTPHYRHQLVFPNCTMATTRGLNYALQLFEPLSPGSTLFTSMVFSARLPPGPVVDAINQTAAAMNRTVFSEDRAVCETLQAGVADAVRPGILSDEEERVAHFHKCYMEELP